MLIYTKRQGYHCSIINHLLNTAEVLGAVQQHSEPQGGPGQSSTVRNSSVRLAGQALGMQRPPSPRVSLWVPPHHTSAETSHLKIKPNRSSWSVWRKPRSSGTGYIGFSKLCRFTCYQMPLDYRTPYGIGEIFSATQVSYDTLKSGWKYCGGCKEHHCWRSWDKGLIPSISIASQNI